MAENINIERLRDLYRVHDTTKKHKKEKKSGDDDREFKEFLEESGKEPEGYHDYVPEEFVEQPPAKTMLDALGAHAAPFFKIEPLEPEKEKETESKIENGKRETGKSQGEDKI